MKINRKDLVARLKKIKDVVPPVAKKDKSISGIMYSGGKFIANNTSIAVSTDYELGIDTSFVLPVSAVNFIENMNDSEIEIAVSGNSVTISGAKCKGKFATCDISELLYSTKLPDIDDQFLTYDDDEFLDVVNSIMYACSTLDTKPAQTGVLLESDNGMLEAVACDGIKIAKNSIPYVGEIKVVIPKTAFKKVLSLTCGKGIKLHKTSERNRVAFTIGEYTVYVLLLDNKEFFDYHKIFNAVLPQSNNIVKVNRNDFIDVLQRARLCDASLTKVAIEIHINAGENKFVVCSTSTTNEFTEEVACEGSYGADYKIACNVDYLTEMLKYAGGEFVVMVINGELKPIVIKDAGNYIGLLQPVRRRAK